MRSIQGWNGNIVKEERSQVALIKVQDLQVCFEQDAGTIMAVDGITFNIGSNEVVGLVGESGSGKTITSLSIMKLLPERRCSLGGKIIFEDRDILELSEREMLAIRCSKIAMVFQEPFTSLNPVMTVGEQIDEVMLAHTNVSKGEAKKRSLSILDRIKIASPLRIYNAYPHLLSGGERQRAMIAMAVALKPRLLIADEPTTALDVTIQEEILTLILDIKKELGISVLFVTHDFGIVKKVADRVIVMKDGNIVESGKTDVMLLSPGDDYTKRLIEAIPKIDLTAPKKRREERPAAIDINSLSKSFLIGKGLFQRERTIVKAVNNVSFKVEEGRTLGLVGESGSGKTTVGKIIAGIIEADSGHIRVSGSGTRHKLQMVFQDPYSSLDPRMKMRDIVLEGPTIQGLTKGRKETILRDVLLKVRLDYKDSAKYPHQFSGGQRQRISIARALAVDPRILILDEPVSSLDVIIQRDILDLLKELQNELSLTYLFISHDLRVIEYMADDIAVMQKGEIVELDTSDRIYRSPKHPYTRRLLSSIPEL
ncbi:MAG: ABC transporter ATP-binding protein [Candidatus Omnitrophota bacterium]